MSTRSVYNIEVDSVESDDSWGSDVFDAEFPPMPEYKHAEEDFMDDPELKALLWEELQSASPTASPTAQSPARKTPETLLLDALEADLDKLVAAGPFDKICKGCGRKGLKRRRE